MRIDAGALIDLAGGQDISQNYGSAIQKLINRDLINGRQSGVRGTPAIFFNGKRLNNRSLAGFQQAIDAALRKM